MHLNPLILLFCFNPKLASLENGGAWEGARPCPLTCVAGRSDFRLLLYIQECGICPFCKVPMQLLPEDQMGLGPRASQAHAV